MHRAKNLITKEWIEGYLLRTKEAAYICLPNQRDDDLFMFPEQYIILVDEETVCSSKEIKDKNDKTIFQKDICKYFNEEDGDGMGIIEDDYVHWIKGTIAKKHIMTPLFYLKCSSEWEIIGNTIDNPELM